MTELIALLTIYYHCTALAEAGLLDQSDRFDCNETYQEVKAEFLDDALRQPGAVVTSADNAAAYVRFKAWERDNPDLVQSLKGQ